jgi:hypothetical protein
MLRLFASQLSFIMNNANSSSTVDNQPTEAAFLKQAEVAREALKNFLAIKALNHPAIIKPALYEVITSTVRSHYLISKFCFNFKTSIGRVQLIHQLHREPDFSRNPTRGSSSSRRVRL